MTKLQKMLSIYKDNKDHYNYLKVLDKKNVDKFNEYEKEELRHYQQQCIFIRYILIEVFNFKTNDKRF